MANVLGLSMSRHDRAAALWMDGRPAIAIAEERIDRRKRSKAFYADGFATLPPMGAATYVLNAAGVNVEDVDLVVCGRSVSTCIDDAVAYLPFQAEKILELPLPSHHLAHAYSALATAPFRDCAILVADEQGHHLGDAYESITWFSADNDDVSLVKSFNGSRDRLSLGMMYDLFTTLVGLTEAGLPAAGKLMALSACGSRSALPTADWLVLADSGGAYVDPARLEAFLLEAGMPSRSVGQETVDPFERLALRFAPIHWDTDLAKNLATVAQTELEGAVMHSARSLHEVTGLNRLAFAGGVALNCVANARLASVGFADVFVHPAATDDGIAMGLAAYGSMKVLGERRETGVFSPYLGRRYPAEQSREALEDYGLGSVALTVGPKEAAAELADGRLLCWFSGRSEWGPRALGARSILADPRIEGLVDLINCRVKYRERFRPFGVSVLEEDADLLLDLSKSAPGLDRYMLSVAYPRDSRLNGITHYDGTIRHQVVGREAGAYYELLKAFRELTGLGALLNTSFNTWGEPLVESPTDAVRQFLLCGADSLYLDGLLLRRTDLSASRLSSACSLAQSRTHVKPLARALTLEACGYEDAALQIARNIPSDLSHGPEHEVSRAALMMRLLARSAPDEALECAERVLELSGLGRPAYEAATFIEDTGGSLKVPNARAAELIAEVARQGGVLALISDVFGSPRGQ